MTHRDVSVDPREEHGRNSPNSNKEKDKQLKSVANIRKKNLKRLRLSLVCYSVSMFKTMPGLLTALPLKKQLSSG